MDAAPRGAPAPQPPAEPHRDGTFANNFWGAGDRGYDTVIRRVKDTGKTLDDLRAYYKARAEIEAEYAKRMAKLARTPIGQDESGAIAAALATLQQETDRMAHTHQGVADELKTNLSSEVGKFQQSQAGFLGPAVDAIVKLAYSRRTQQTMLDRARDKYQAECVKVNTFTAQMTLVQGRDLERTNVKLEKAKRDVEATERDYRQYTKVIQAATHNWNREWKAFLDQAQDHDEERIEFVKQNCWRYINAVAEACVEDDNACQDLFDAFKASDAARDSAHFVAERGTGNMIFDPPEFVNFAEGHAPAQRPPYRVAHFSRISKRPPPPISTDIQETTAAPVPAQASAPAAASSAPAPALAFAPASASIRGADMPPATPVKDAAAGFSTTPSRPAPFDPAGSAAPAPADADALYSSPRSGARIGQDDIPYASAAHTSSPAPAHAYAAPADQLAQTAPALASASPAPTSSVPGPGRGSFVASNPFTGPASAAASHAMPPPSSAAGTAGAPGTSSVPAQDHVPVEDRLAAALRGLQVAKGETPAAAPDTAFLSTQSPVPAPAAAQGQGYQPAANPFEEHGQTQPLFHPPPPQQQQQHLQQQQQQQQQPQPQPQQYTPPPASQPYQQPQAAQTQPTYQPPPQPTYQPLSPPPAQALAQQPVSQQSQPQPQPQSQSQFQTPSAAIQYMRDYQRQSGMVHDGSSPWTGATPAPPPATATGPAIAAASTPAHAASPGPTPAPATASASAPTYTSAPAAQTASWQGEAEAEAAAAAAAPVSLTGKLTDEGLPVQFYVKAMFDYTATTDQEFSFTEGDIIAVTEYPPDGWWKGELMDEARRRPGANLFPSNFCSLLV